MSERTCAGYDCKPDAGAIEVKVGGRTIEVCCEDYTDKLKEANASTTAQRG